jgi:hypothetical protein
VASGHEPTDASDRWGASTWLYPNDGYPLVLRGSTRRAEVKLDEVGSRWGFCFVTGSWPTMLVLDTGKKAVVGSGYCCAGSVCTTDFFREGETPELRTCETPAVVLSPQRARLRFQLSDSDEATREPEPVLPSMESVAVLR